MKALIVDDNTLNLKIAQKLIEQEGLEVDIVQSGFECLEKVKDNQYDVIFMDIMMPEMDGVETYKKLKEIDGFNTPVITLTADAKLGAEENYLRMGFYDYIPKPINKDRLKEILNKIIGGKNIVDTEKDSHDTIENLNNNIKDSVSRDSDTKGNLEYLKENGIDVDESIALLGDLEMFNQTLNDFVKESKTRIPRIMRNKMTENMKDYSIDVHAMKSDSKYLGFKKLAELSYEHELKSKENNYEYVTLHFDELIDEYVKIKKIIDKYL